MHAFAYIADVLFFVFPGETTAFHAILFLIIQFSPAIFQNVSL